jgi:tRNA-dihydrouridine synthase B
MDIKGVELSGPVVLGPMAGVTSLAYRDFMKPFGVALSYSEMISDCGLVYGNENTIHYARTSQIDRPVGLQLFGSDINVTAKAISILEKEADYDVLDINLGCPVYKVTKTGAGSAWLKKPQELYEYMRVVVASSHKPVSAKIRLGWDETSINVKTIAPMLAEAGVSLLTVHARTTKQGYSGKANYEIIRDLGESLAIPLCVSGDIFTPQNALEAMRITGASLVMVARGGLGNPLLVTNINRLCRHELMEDPTSLIEEVEWAESFSHALVAQEGEKAAIMQLRGLIPHFFFGFPGYKKIRSEISMNIKTYEDLLLILEGIRNRSRL